MNIPNKHIKRFYAQFCVKNKFRTYFFIFCAFSMLSFSSCSDSTESWENVNSEKVLFAASSTSTNSIQKNEFEKVLSDFLAIPSDNELKEYIHPKLGFYINHKPGAISVVEHFNDLEEVYEQLPHLETYFKKFNGKNPQNEETPQFDCESFTKQGTFYQTVASFDEIEKGIEINEKIINKVHSKEEKEFAKNTDKKISRIVVLTDDYLEIGFTNIDGKWYMLWFNLAKFDCSA